MSFDNAVSLRDAVVQARAEGGGEARLRMRLIMKKEATPLRSIYKSALTV